MKGALAHRDDVADRPDTLGKGPTPPALGHVLSFVLVHCVREDRLDQRAQISHRHTHQNIAMLSAPVMMSIHRKTVSGFPPPFVPPGVGMRLLQAATLATARRHDQPHGSPTGRHAKRTLREVGLNRFNHVQKRPSPRLFVSEYADSRESLFLRRLAQAECSFSMQTIMIYAIG